MDYGQLINQVHMHRELYDPSNRKYGDNQRKEVIWKIIGEKLNQPGHVCKKQWTGLRDCFRRVIRKKRMNISGASRAWKYEEEMSFLVPFFQERKPSSAPEAILSDLESEYSNDERKTNNVSDDNNSNEFIQTEKNMVIPTNDSTTTKEIQNKNYKISRKNVVNSFFNSMAETVNTFNPIRQNAVKRKIFEIVSEMELEQIKEDSNYFKETYQDAQEVHFTLSRSPSPYESAILPNRDLTIKKEHDLSEL